MDERETWPQRSRVMKTGNIVKITAIFLMCALGLLAVAAPAAHASATGYSEYYIPGGEDAMALALKRYGPATANNNMQVIISITAWSDNVKVYYDHWENGYGFDPDNPAGTADEIFYLDLGDVETLNNGGTAVPTPRDSNVFYYDGGDRIYVAGGTVTVTKAGYMDGRSLQVQACAWEIYPVTPQLTTYVLPFGENLLPLSSDFRRVFVLIQATADNTTFKVDLGGTGTFNQLDVNFNGAIDPGEPETITLGAGETFILGPVNDGPAFNFPQINGINFPGQGARATVNSNTLIQGSATLQVKFIIGNSNVNYDTRGVSAFPRGFWTKDYYAPVNQPVIVGGSDNTIGNTDIFLYNPHDDPITINWETLNGSGFFSINGGDSVSYRAAAGPLPLNGGAYLSGSDVFWGISNIDSGDYRYSKRCTRRSSTRNHF